MTLTRKAKVAASISRYFIESIEYTRREKVELTKQDIEDIEAWKSIQEQEKQNIIEALVQKFEPTVTGNEFAKKALLLAGVNAGIKNNDSRDPRRLRINVILVGDPSLAKSVLMRKIVTLLPNARYESAQGSTGISLTFMVSKESDAHVLRLGPIPLANGSLCAINEMGQMPLEQQRHFLDFAEEGQSTNNKHGIHAHIIGNTSLIGSSNPYGGRWKHPNEIGLDEIPILSQIIERTDMLIVFRETQPDRQKDREYVNAINKIRKNNKIGRFSGYDEFLKKYLMYARTFNPGGEISEDALNMIDEYWIEMSQRGVLGRYRKLEALKRISVAVSKIKLKNEVDVEDVTEMMALYNIILMHFNQIVPAAQKPSELAYEICIDILREMSPYQISFTELIKSACDRKEQVKSYIGDDLVMRDNHKLRDIYDDLVNNPHTVLVNKKPAVFKWQSSDEQRTAKEIVEASEQSCDPCDACDEEDEGPVKKEYKDNEKSLKENKSGVISTSAHESYASHSTYEHLIVTEDMPINGKTAYRCKEHPDKWDTDLKGLEISHFQPDHDNNADTSTPAGNVQ